MKYILFPAVLIFLTASCAPVYKCGDPIPLKTPVLWSQNLKDAVSERDNLCRDLAAKKKEIICA